MSDAILEEEENEVRDRAEKGKCRGSRRESLHEPRETVWQELGVGLDVSAQCD